MLRSQFNSIELPEHIRTDGRGRRIIDLPEDVRLPARALPESREAVLLARIEADALDERARELKPRAHVLHPDGSSSPLAPSPAVLADAPGYPVCGVALIYGLASTPIFTADIGWHVRLFERGCEAAAGRVPLLIGHHAGPRIGWVTLRDGPRELGFAGAAALDDAMRASLKRQAVEISAGFTQLRARWAPRPGRTLMQVIEACTITHIAIMQPGCALFDGCFLMAA
jgi:hypothetical protein